MDNHGSYPNRNRNFRAILNNTPSNSKRGERSSFIRLWKAKGLPMPDDRTRSTGIMRMAISQLIKGKIK